MCAHCGCESLESIALLTAEHDRVIELSVAVLSALQANDLDMASGLARSITTVLEPHTAVEERALFPAMAVDYPDYVAGLLNDHYVIDAVLCESVDGTPTDPAWPARLQDALSLLRTHIRKEENGLFPAALTTLSTEAWEAVDRARGADAAARPNPSGTW